MDHSDRNITIFTMYLDGSSYKAIASSFSISVSRVREIIKKFVRVINENGEAFIEKPIKEKDLRNIGNESLLEVINDYFVLGKGAGEYSWMGPISARSRNVIRYHTDISNKGELRKALQNGDLLPRTKDGVGMQHLGLKSYNELISYVELDDIGTPLTRKLKSSRQEYIDKCIALLEQYGYTVIPPNDE